MCNIHEDKFCLQPWNEATLCAVETRNLKNLSKNATIIYKNTAYYTYNRYVCLDKMMSLHIGYGSDGGGGGKGGCAYMLNRKMFIFYNSLVEKPYSE